MSEQGLRQAQHKMAEAGVNAAAIEVFSHYYAQLEAGATGLIGEGDIEPLTEPPQLEQVRIDPGAAREALSRTAILPP